MERLSLHKAAEKLGYKDLRSASRWCRNNRVAIFSDIGCRAKYVLASEFEAAWGRAGKAHLKRRHGENLSAGFLPSLGKDSKVPFTKKQFTNLRDSQQGFIREKEENFYGKNEKRFAELLESLSINHL